MNLSGDFKYNSIFYRLGTLDLSAQRGQLLYDEKRKLTYVIEAQSARQSIDIWMLDSEYNELDFFSSRYDHTPDVRLPSRYNRFTLSEDGTQIYIAANYFTDGVNEARIGYIDIDFDDLASSSITLSPVVYTSNSTSGSLVYFKEGDNLYINYQSSTIGTFSIIDISTGAQTINTALLNQRSLSWLTDYNNKVLYLLVQRNLTRIYLIKYDFVNDVILNTSANYISVTTVDSSLFGNSNLIKVEKGIATIAYMSAADTYMKVAKFDLDLSLITETEIITPLAINSASSSEGLRFNNLIKSEGSAITFAAGRGRYKILASQVDKSVPIISGEIVSEEQDDLTIPFTQEYDEVELRRFDGSNLIKDRSGRISVITDSARGLNMIQKKSKLQAIYWEDATFNNKPSILFDGYQNGVSFGASFNKAFYNTFLDLSLYATDEIWILWSGRNPTLDKLAYLWSDGGSKYIEIDRDNEIISQISGGNDATYSSVLNLGNANLCAIRMKAGETSQLYINGQSGLVSSNIALTTDNFPNDFTKFMDVEDGRLILARMVVLKTTDLDYAEKTAYINNEMQDMATEYDLTWNDLI